jgi:hypothetical protein
MECTMRVRASGSFRRYSADVRAVAGGLAKLRDDAAALEKRFHGQRFRSIDQAGSAVSSVGWTRGDCTVPARFDADELWLARKLLIGALRVDRKQLPSGALRVRRMEAEAAERRNAGERIAPARRREIVEKIEGDLMARMVPSTAIHQMLWRAETGDLLLNATSESANVAFRALFRETFEVAPEPLVTATLAARLAGEKKVAELVPAVFAEGGVAIVDDSPAFLGPEFLLWLWHHAETAGGNHALGELGEAGVAFDQMLELGGAKEAGRVIVRGDLPTRAGEAASALLAGRLPLKARLVVACGAKSFEVTLAAATFDLDGVKVTADAESIDDENLRAADEQRAGWLFELQALLDALFAKFLELRVARSFESTLLPDLRRWIVSRARARTRAAVAS